GDDANQQSAQALDYAGSRGLTNDDAVVDQRCQSLQFVREVFVEHNVEAAFEGRFVDASPAVELLQQLAAEPIVRGQSEPSFGGEALIDGGPPMLRRFLVLSEAGVQLRNRGGTQAENLQRPARRHPLEI